MKIKQVMWLFLALTFITPSTALPSESIDTIFEKANQAYDNREFSQAIELYKKVIEKDPGNLSALFWSANAAQILEDYEQEIGFLKKLKIADPTGIKPREGLIVAYQKTGKFNDLATEREALYALYNETKETKFKDKRYFNRDKFTAGDFTIVAVEYFELTGKLPKKYFFYGQNSLDQSIFVVSFGSYPWATEIERELGNIKANERIYHLDGYDGERHFTFGFTQKELKYNVVKKRAFAIFEKNDPAEISISSSNFKGGLSP